MRLETRKRSLKSRPTNDKRESKAAKMIQLSEEVPINRPKMSSIPRVLVVKEIIRKESKLRREIERCRSEIERTMS